MGKEPTIYQEMILYEKKKNILEFGCFAMEGPVWASQFAPDDEGNFDFNGHQGNDQGQGGSSGLLGC